MLNELRSHAGNFGFKVMLVLLVLAFGIWGIGDMLRHTGSNVEVASVGGKSIPIEEFQRALRQQTETVRQQLGDRYTPELLKSLHLPEHVVHDLVQQALLAQETKALQLIPGDADVVRRIRSNPAFQDEKGNFSKVNFETALHHINLSEKTYVEKLRQDIATGLLLETLSAAAPVPESAVQTLYESRQQQREATLYTLSASSVPLPGKPDDAQVAAFYHENESAFNVPEFRNVSYISFNNADAQSHAAVSEAELKQAYQERADDFKTPERRTVDQLIFDSEAKAKKAAAELKGGTSLEQVVKTNPVMNKNAVAMGKVERSNILEAAQSAVFSLPSGGISDPIQSPFGWHVFRIGAITPPGAQSFEEAKPVLEKELKQKAGEEALNKMANALEDAIAGGASLQEAAKEFHLTVHSAGPFDHAGKATDGKTASGLPDFDKFLDTAFKTGEKTESSLIGSKGGVNYLVRVDSVSPARLRALDEVKGLATTGWQQQEHAKRAGDLAIDLAKKFQTPALRESAIATGKLKVSALGPLKRTDRRSDGLPLELLGDLFSRKTGESTAAYPLGNGDYAFAVVKNIIPAPKVVLKDDKLIADIRQELGTVSRREILEDYIRYLGGKYPVSVNQALLEPPADDAR